MPLSVQPLVIAYSFTGARRGASDRVNAAQLDVIFGQIAGKINELVTALNVTTRDDDELDDEVVESRHLANDALDQISSLINARVTPP